MSNSLVKRGPRTEEGRARCGNWRHGRRSRTAKREAACLREFLRSCRKTIVETNGRRDNKDRIETAPLTGRMVSERWRE